MSIEMLTNLSLFYLFKNSL